MQTPVAPLCNLIVKVVIAACQRIDVRFVQRRAERAERRALLPHALYALAVLVKDQMGTCPACAMTNSSSASTTFTKNCVCR